MSVLENLSALISYVRKSKDPELMNQVIDLQTSILELQDRVRSLERENEDLKRKLSVQDSLVVKYGVYFSKNEDEENGPFCTRCWDVNENLLRLDVRTDKMAWCPECKYIFQYKYKPKPRKSR